MLRAALALLEASADVTQSLKLHFTGVTKGDIDKSIDMQTGNQKNVFICIHLYLTMGMQIRFVHPVLQ